MPHPPQLELLVRMLVSQPLAPFPSQLAKPALQTGTHVPARQVLEPLSALHTFPQEPQLAESLVKFLQTSPQRVWPDGQGAMHWPFWQVCPPGQQVFPQTISPCPVQPVDGQDTQVQVVVLRSCPPPHAMH